VFGFGKKEKRKEELRQMGANYADSFIRELDRVLELRFGAVSENYMMVFRAALLAALKATDAPPIFLARVDFDFFCEQVDELKVNIRSFVDEAMSEWIKTNEEFGFAEVSNQAIEHRISNITSNLKLEGLNLFTEYMRPLKDADGLFRLEYPEIAANFPEDEES